MKNLLLALGLVFSVNAFSETSLNIEEEINIDIGSEDSLSIQEEKGTEVHHYHFGQIPAGYRRSTTYTVTNIGNGILNFQTTYLWGSEFRSIHNCFGTLYPRQRCQFTLTYSPMYSGYHHGAFEIHFYPYSVIRVNLSGHAYRY